MYMRKSRRPRTEPCGTPDRRLLYWIYFADQLDLFVYVPLDMKRTNLRFESDFKGVCLLRSALILLLNTEYALPTFASLPTAPIKSICDSSFRKVGSG